MAPIHEALRQHDVEALRRELERGVDPDLRDPANGNRTPLQLLPYLLYLATDSMTTQVVQCYRLLLENGASVNVRDAINDTVLHDACFKK